MKINMEKTILTEDDQSKVQEKILMKDSKMILSVIKQFLDELKLADDRKFDELLQVLHGRFSKLELNLIKLKRLKNESI